MPNTPGPLTLKEVIRRVYKREKDCHERSCYLASQAALDDQSLETPPNDIENTDYYEAARKIIEKEDAQNLGRSVFRLTAFCVTTVAFLEASKHRVPGFDWEVGYADEYQSVFRLFCEWLINGVGSDEPMIEDLQRAYDILEQENFCETLIVKLLEQCPEESAEIGLPKSSDTSTLVGIETEGIFDVHDKDALTKDDVKILEILKEASPQLMTLKDIENSRFRISRKTAGKWLKELITRKFVDRPLGKYKGATITSRGLKILQKIDSKSTQ